MTDNDENTVQNVDDVQDEETLSNIDKASTATVDEASSYYEDVSKTTITPVSSIVSVSEDDYSVEEEELSGQEKIKIIRHPLDDLSFEDVASTIKGIQADVLHLSTENDMFERYLYVNEPILLEGMAVVIENALKLQDAETARRATLVDTQSIRSIQSVIKIESAVLAGSIVGKGPRINFTQKLDMVSKEMDDFQKGLKKLYKDEHKNKCRLKAELEEIDIELLEAKEHLESFEQIVVVEGVDQLTQRIPAEKFTRFMQEYLRSCLAVIQKYRLRQSTLTSHLKKLRQVLKEKKELGESLHAVDFEKLHIENSHFLKKIDLRTTHLTELKRMNGGANLILTNQKKFLMKQVTEMQEIQKEIDETITKTDALEKECREAEIQLDKAIGRYEAIKKMKEEYSVPDVMAYVKIKSKVSDLQKNIKIWTRRSNLQNVTLNSSVREMKNITGSKKVLDSWFDRPPTARQLFAMAKPRSEDGKKLEISFESDEQLFKLP